MLTTGTPEVVLAAPAPKGAAPREARVRPEHARLYPGIAADRWECAATLADRVLAGWLLRGRAPALGHRVLLDGHFEFRGGHGRHQADGTERPRREDR